MNVIGDYKKKSTFDAIIVGSGISGGWAAKELTQKGLNCLLLERGRDVEHIKDYPTAFKAPWEFDHRLINSNESKKESPIQSTAFDEGNKHFFVNDKEHPYIQSDPFNWIRGYQVGGRSLTWGRQCYRLSDLDFEANAKEGVGVDWPIRYVDLKTWYDHVEEFVGISGQKEGLPHLPDGKFLPPIEMNCIEKYFKNQITSNYADRIVTVGRAANLTSKHKGRGPCQFRNLCSRGCPFGGYFSSNTATLPVAFETGNLTMLTNSIVVEVLMNKDETKAIGVKVIDSETREVREFLAKIIFLNASTIATASILLNFKSERHPNGLGNSSGQLGRNLMDHFVSTGAEGEIDIHLDKYYKGRNPSCIYIPRFRNLEDNDHVDFKRGYAYQGYGERMEWRDMFSSQAGFGKEYKDKLLKPGNWRLWIGAWGETLPYNQNIIELDTNKKDKWGIPLVKIHFKYGENEEKMRKDIKSNAVEMLEKAGFFNIKAFEYHKPPGSAIHEMGTARMGKDPDTSVLNKFNQMHEVKNIFITDGSCMTSSANQNPSLTYMALTARAANNAVEFLDSNKI